MAEPKLAVYSHIVFATLKPDPEVPEQVLIARTHETYHGPLVVGRDLTSIIIDDDVHAVDAQGQSIQPNLAEQ